MDMEMMKERAKELLESEGYPELIDRTERSTPEDLTEVLKRLHSVYTWREIQECEDYNRMATDHLTNAIGVAVNLEDIKNEWREYFAKRDAHIKRLRKKRRRRL